MRINKRNPISPPTVAPTITAVLGFGLNEFGFELLVALLDGDVPEDDRESTGVTMEYIELEDVEFWESVEELANVAEVLVGKVEDSVVVLPPLGPG